MKTRPDALIRKHHVVPFSPPALPLSRPALPPTFSSPVPSSSLPLSHPSPPPPPSSRPLSPPFSRPVLPPFFPSRIRSPLPPFPSPLPSLLLPLPGGSCTLRSWKLCRTKAQETKVQRLVEIIHIVPATVSNLYVNIELTTATTQPVANSTCHVPLWGAGESTIQPPQTVRVTAAQRYARGGHRVAGIPREAVPVWGQVSVTAFTSVGRRTELFISVRLVQFFVRRTFGCFRAGNWDDVRKKPFLQGRKLRRLGECTFWNVGVLLKEVKRETKFLQIQAQNKE